MQTATLNAQVTFVHICSYSIAVAISALAGGAKTGFAPSPDSVGVCVFFDDFLRVGGQDGMEMECCVVLRGFWQRQNGQE